MNYDKHIEEKMWEYTKGGPDLALREEFPGT